jgi:S-adenosylmethionine synthetase
MGVRRARIVDVTVACAMIGRHLSHLDDYFSEARMLQDTIASVASKLGLAVGEAKVNAADDRSSGAVYLTVTGTSAEGGDDGQVGRGNRVNGLITPSRLMSLEAAAGKNPVSHVGKIYNVLARGIAEGLVAELPEITAADCTLVSRIGEPVTQPAAIQVRLAAVDDAPVEMFAARAEEIAVDRLKAVPKLIDGFVAGTVGVF